MDLFERKMESQFDFVIVVSAQPAACNERIKTRSQLTVEEIEERTLNHLPLKIKEAKASAIIRNDGSLDDLEKAVSQALVQLKILPSR